MTKKKFSKFFDHTLLAPEATEYDIKMLCREAAKYDFYSVCVNSCYVELAKKELAAAGAEHIKVAAVVGFPLGAMHTTVKTYETSCACFYGADEINMVINVGALIDGRVDYVKNEISQIRQKAYENDAIVKVILETCLLTEDEIAKGCRCIMETGANFVKTSTGFSERGADTETIRLIKGIVGERVMIKASGGIRDLRTARDMIVAGADRLGTSNTVNIMKEYLSAFDR